MPWTKRQLVEDAFAEIGLATYIFDIEPDAIIRATRKMDGILARWNSEGIRIGYPLSSTPDPDDICDIPDVAYNAIVQNLGLSLAPSYGKQVSPDLRIEAGKAYKQLLSFTMVVPEVDISYLPSGAGNKPGRTNQEFMSPTADKVSAGKDSDLDI